ncbi:o-succinylbenzoate synthase [Ectothiorhodospira mobilis]|uniref:o-succinylbenzoate synthase n=1 Tax=Ectothiorhodospira mobilis TaxID=195064 RepID=UPI001EE80676|nr:o-succinylbenzoate synthase [Ectothiorhodospira mobilis]MCG5536784.1 o-succinylbenzoate synthase [Ectothiorhodospira mobilis]
MSIPHRLHLWRFRLPLTAPLDLGAVTLDQREGLLLQWERDGAPCVWSEISPLPGFSPHDLETCQRALQERLRRPGSLAARLGGDLRELPAEVRFGIEAGLLQCTTPLPPARPLPRCRLLRHDDPARSGPAPGSACIKLKVGRAAPRSDRETLRALLQRLKPGQRLRLDANRSWSLEDARTVLEGMDPQRIEFVEEPLRPGLDYAPWPGISAVPFAWDETLRADSAPFPARALDTPGLGALVLKPMLTGLTETQRLMAAARARGLQVILSAAYESNLTLDLYARLADHWGLPGPHGLDTFSVLGEALLAPIDSQPEHQQHPLCPQEALESLGTWT